MTARVLITGHDQLTLGSDCPDFTFSKTSPVGDQNASVVVPFTQGISLPREDSSFRIEDDVLGSVWTGFTGPIDAPDLSTCSGPATINALGWGLSIDFKRREGETVYGPRWDATVLGATVEQAVIDAMRNAPTIETIDANVIPTGVVLQETQNFVGRGAGEIVNAMAALTQQSATPSLWHVRRGVFYWKALDLAPRYQILMANGAKVKPRFDPSKQYTRVIVGWGKSTEQVAIWPDTIVYDTRQQIVDLYINAGTEARDYATALALAQGIYARLRMLSPEWSLDITISSTCIVEELIDGMWTEINPIGIEPGYFIRIPDLDQGAWGPQFTIPQGGFMTRMQWTNKTATTSISVGEPRATGSFARLARRITAAGVSPLNIWGYLGRDFSSPHRTPADLLGPQMASTPGVAHPPPVEYQTPAVSTKDKTLLPETLPPIPPTFGFQLNTCDTPGVKGVTSVEPVVLEKFSLNASKACTVRLKVTRVSDGVVILPPTVARLDGVQRRLEVVIHPEFTISKPDHLEYAIDADGTPDGSDASMVSPDPVTGKDNYVSIDFRSRRYYPEYPSDPAPKTGKQF